MLHQHLREVFLTLMMLSAYATVIVAGLWLRDIEGLIVIACGVFVAVVGVGLYDDWARRPVEKAKAKPRR